MENGRHTAIRRMVHYHQGLHDGNLETGRQREGLLHDRQQHVGCREEGSKELTRLVQRRSIPCQCLSWFIMPYANLKGPPPGQEYASLFIDFVRPGEGQSIIREYGRALYGEPLYNDAGYARKYNH